MACRWPRGRFHAWAVRAPSKRALWDATDHRVLAGYYEPDERGHRGPESLYGWREVWAHLQREGVPVAKSTVERLMRRNGSPGVRRQKSVRTTIADPTAARPPVWLIAGSVSPHPIGCLWPTSPSCKLVTGVFVYVAFVIDAYAGTIVGWESSGVQADPVRGVGASPGCSFAIPSGPSDRRRYPPLRLCRGFVEPRVRAWPRGTR